MMPGGSKFWCRCLRIQHALVVEQALLSAQVTEVVCCHGSQEPSELAAPVMKQQAAAALQQGRPGLVSSAQSVLQGVSHQSASSP